MSEDVPPVLVCRFRCPSAGTRLILVSKLPASRTGGLLSVVPPGPLFRSRVRCDHLLIVALKSGTPGGTSGLRLPYVDHDGFGEAVLGAHAILAPEVLEKSEAAFEHGGSVAERSLDRLPHAHP